MTTKKPEIVHTVPRPGGREAVYEKAADGTITRSIRETKTSRQKVLAEITREATEDGAAGDGFVATRKATADSEKSEG